MSGSKSTNSQAVQFEKEQAAKAEAKEAQRQGRLTQGKTLVDQIFEGSPVMANVKKNFDWSSIAAPTAATAQMQQQAAQGTGGVGIWGAGDPAALSKAAGSTLPEGFSWVQTTMPMTAQQTRDAQVRAASAKPQYGLIGTQGGGTHDKDQWGFSTPTRGGTSAIKAATTAGGGQVWAIKGPDGKIHYMGDDFSYMASVDTGKRTGGFTDDFYNNYAKEYLDLYQPEETRQYDEAKTDLGYNLARQGLSMSSVAADKQGKLEYQHGLNLAKNIADADNAASELRQTVQQQKQAALDQLYSTEDPSLAQNLASSAASAINMKNPTLTPGAAFFTPALSAVGSYIANSTSPYRNYGGGVNPTSANSSSDQTYRK